MHERDKIERRIKENYDLYSGIEVEEVPTWHGIWKAWLSKVKQVDPISRLGVTAMLVLAPRALYEKSSTALCITVAIICVCGMVATVLIIALTRGKNAETGKGSKNPVQPGSPGAGP